MFTAQQITDIGGRRWTSRDGRIERVYLNDWHALAGIRLTRYNTGNIRSASVDGEKISNTRAAKLIEGVKVFWQDGEIHTPGLDDERRERLLANLADEVE